MSARRSTWFVLRTWFVYRAVLFCVMYFARGQFPSTIRLQGKGFLHAFTAWDGRWYHDIVKNGYAYTPGRESNVAFFPAYPYAVRALTPLFGGDDFLAGVVLSNVLLVPALLLLFAWVKHAAGQRAAERAVRYALLFPSTHFFSCFYTESMFLFAIAGALYAYQTRRPWLYVPFAFLAGCTRPTGVLLAGACVLGELVRAWHEPDQRTRTLVRAPLWLAPLLGLGAYMALLHVQVGDALAFSKTQAAWGHHWTAPWRSIAHEFAHPLEAYRQFEAYASMVLLPLGLYALWRLPVTYGVFFFAQVLLATSTGITASAVRYMAGSGVLYLLLASFGPKVERWLLPALALLAAFAATCFAGGYWAG